MNDKSVVALKDYFQTLDNRYASFKTEMENFVGIQLENMINLNGTLQNQLDDYKEEVENLNKVSIISNLNKQIKNLTKELEMYKTKHKTQQKTIDDLNICLEKTNDENAVNR